MVELQGRGASVHGGKVRAVLVALPALLLTLFVATPAGWLVGWLASALAVLLLLVYPGYLLLRLLAPSWRLGRAAWPVAAVLGYGLWTLPAVALILLHGTLEHLLLLAVAVTALLAWRAARQEYDRPGGWLRQPAGRGLRTVAVTLRRHWWAELLFWGALAAALGLFWAFAGVERFSDRQSYLTQIRYYLDAPALGTEDMLPYGDVGTRMQLAAWLVQLAAIARAAKVDASLLYSATLPPLMIVLSLLAAWGLGRAVTGSRRGAGLGAALLAVHWAGTMALPSTAGYGWLERVQLRPEGAFATLGYWATSSHILEDKFILIFLMLPVAQLLLLRYWQRGGWRRLLLLGVALVGLSFVHQLGAAFFGMTFAGLGVVRLLRRPRRETLVRIAAVAALLVIAAAPPFLQRNAWLEFADPALIAPGLADDFVNHGPAVVGLWVWPAQPDFFAVDMFVLWRQPLVMLALLLLPLLAVWRRLRSIGDQWIAAMLLTGLLVTYNPLVAPLLSKVITYRMLFRTTWLIELPAMLLLARLVLLGLGLLRLRSRTFALRRAVWEPLLVGGLLVGALALLGPGTAAGLTLLRDVRAAALTAEEKEVLAYLREHGRPRSIAWAGPELVDEIPPATGRVYGPYFRYSSSDGAYYGLLRNFYAGASIEPERLALLAEHQPDYVIAATGSAVDRQLGELVGAWEAVYRNEAQVVYALRPQARASEPLASLLAAYAAQQGGQLASAEETLAAVLAAWPDNLSAQALRVETLLAAGREEEALAAAQRAAAVEPGSEWALALVGQTERRRAQRAAARGDTAAAIAGYQAALALAADDRVSARLLAAQLGPADTQPAAKSASVAALQAAAAYQPGRTTDERRQAYWDLAGAQEALGEMEAAEAAHQAAIDLTRRWDSAARGAAIAELGRFYVRSGRMDAARLLYAQSVQRNPTAPALYDAWAELAAAEGGSAAALVYAQAAAANSRAAWPHVRQAQVEWQQNGNAATAQAALQKALALDASRQDAYALAAQIYQSEGDATAAEALWQEAAAANPRAVWPLQTLAELALDRGDYRAAVEALGEAVALAPNNIVLNTAWQQARQALEQQVLSLAYLEETAAGRPDGAEWVVVDQATSTGWHLVGYAGNQAALIAGEAPPLWLFWEAPGAGVLAGSEADGWQRIGARLWVQEVAGASNLVSNGDFAKSTATGAAAGFPHDVYGANPATRQVQLVERGGESTVVAALVNGPADRRSSYVSPQIGVRADQLYLQMGTMRSRGGSGYLGVRWQAEGEPESEETYAASNQTTGDWRSVRQLLEPPPDATRLDVLLLNLEPGGSVLFDDLLLLAVDAPGLAAKQSRLK